MYEPKVLILFSGGADSVLLLHRALEKKLNPFCVMIDYEQTHKAELKFGKAYLKKFCVPSQTVTIHGLRVKSGLTTGETFIYEGVHEMYVPSRNLMFLSIAASIAESNKINLIWYGANYSDMKDNFPDCRHGWVDSVNHLLAWNGSMEMTLEAPLLEELMFKHDVLSELHSRGINMKEIFSGYGDGPMQDRPTKWEGI